MNYYPVCVKTDYSLLQSLIKIDDLISFLVNHKINSCAIVDDNLSGSIEFYQKCLNNNIKPLIGFEVLYDDKLIYLYAKNKEGYYNLIKINSLIETGDLNKISLAKYSNNIILVIPFKSNSLLDELVFFDEVYVGYQNEVEKKNSLLLTNNILYINPVKTLDKEKVKFLETLNKLGGVNNLTENNILTNLEKDDLMYQKNFIDKINIKLDFNKLYIPKYKKDVDSFLYLKKLANTGLDKRLNNNVSETYQKRLDYELSVINEMGFVDYFLICYDYVLFAHKNNILVGPGRGSAAGSLVCYSIGITDVDPIKYGLLFERFLNIDRVSMPDIDIDFDSEKRESIINYVKEKYGFSKVAIGLTYNTYKTKLILRDLSKVLDIKPELFEKFIKEVPNNIDLKNIYSINKVKRYIDFYPELKNLYNLSLNFEGLKKNISHHAAGVVISSVNLDEVIPVKNINDILTTGITMEYLETLGLLKMDLLSLKNLTTIANITSKLSKNTLKNISLKEEAVYELFKSAKTDGIFQYETYPMKKVLLALQPNNFDELVAAVALVRPGPNKFLNEYIQNKINPTKIIYDHPLLKDILKDTYGIIIYQEQVIKILNVLGGFSNAKADLIRRAMSKKSDREIEKYRNDFIKGCIEKGLDNKKAEELYEKIIRFSMYGFNKSHSVAYALIGYQMGYLKTFHKEEFYTEYLKSNKFIKNILSELKECGFKIVKPDINYSKTDSYFKDKHLILPLTTIKGLTSKISEDIVSNQPYSDYFDFLIKNRFSLDIIKLLAKADAFNSIDLNQYEIINNYDVVLNYANLGGGIEKPLITKYEKTNVDEIESFGFYIGNHPSSKYNDKSIVKLDSLENHLFKNILCVVVVENIKKTKTKQNKDMAFIDISDETNTSTAIVFEEKIEAIKDIKKYDLVFIEGKVSKSFDKIRIIINNIKRG